MKTHVFIEGRQQLSAMIHNYGNVPAGTPLVIFCHGFTGDKIGRISLCFISLKLLKLTAR
ncbi:MAG: hypothetical protein ABFC57_01775 [Veillonellales bacterium]